MPTTVTMPSASFCRPAPIRRLQPWYFEGDHAAIELLDLLENADLLANLADVAAGDMAGFHVPKQSHDLLGRVFQCRRTTAGLAGPPPCPTPLQSTLPSLQTSPETTTSGREKPPTLDYSTPSRAWVEALTFGLQPPEVRCVWCSATYCNDR